MKFKKLRIPFSPAWSIVCALLIVLWAQSYWWFEIIGRESATSIALLEIEAGSIMLSDRRGPEVGVQQPDWHMSVNYNPIPISEMPLLPFLGFGNGEVDIPIWMVLTLVASLAAVNARWPERFRIRLPERLRSPTLLVAVVLMALALGIGIWLTHR